MLRMAQLMFRNWTVISSAYKFFGMHSGILYGKHDLLEKLFAYKVRPATNSLPGKFETGTQDHEGVAGVLGVIEYFEWVGKEFGREFAQGLAEENYTGRRLDLKKAMTAIHTYESEVAHGCYFPLSSLSLGYDFMA